MRAPRLHADRRGEGVTAPEVRTEEAWKRWLGRNHDKLTGGFEREFATKVFPLLSGITPTDVIAQYGFVDLGGKRRYIDFVVKNDAKGYFLPLELDGLAKDETHAKWNAFLSRQNDLVVRVAPPLRFTNAQLHHELEAVIRRIRDYLGVQERKHRDQQALQQELQTLRNQLQAAPAAVPSYDEVKHQRLEAEKRALEAKLAAIETKKHQIDQETQAALTALEQRALASDEQFNAVKKEASMNARWFIGGLTVVAVAGMYLVANTRVESSAGAPNVSAPIASVLPTETPAPAANNQPDQTREVATQKSQQPKYPKPQDATSIAAGEGKAPVQSQLVTVAAEELSSYVGKKARTCSMVAGVKRFKSGYYLSYGQKFPNQVATVVVWDTALDGLVSKQQHPDSMLGKTICVEGSVQLDPANRPRVNVNSASQLSV